jgi:hypothetical protein
MIHNFDVQLQVALRALEDVVAPALGGGEKHVVEQLMLAIVTIGFVKTRLPAARRYYRMELRGWIDLARVAAQVAGTPDAMAETIGGGERALGDPDADLAEFESASRRLSDGVTALSYASVGQSHHAQLDSLILERGRARVAQYRLWCAPFGFELQPGKLPKPAWVLPGDGLVPESEPPQGI